MFNIFQKHDKEVDDKRFEKAHEETQVILINNKDKNNKINEILANLHRKREQNGHR